MMGWVVGLLSLYETAPSILYFTRLSASVSASPPLPLRLSALLR